jgi:hypothetical protein
MRLPGDAFDVMSGSAEFGKLGLDRAEPGVRPVVVGVPRLPLINLRTDLLEPVVGGLEAAIGPVEVLLRRGEGTFGLPELGLPVGRAVLEERPEFGLFGAEPLDAAGCVVDGEHKPR